MPFYSNVKGGLVILRGKLKEVTDELIKMDRESNSYSTLLNTEISYKRAIKQTEESLNTLLEERYQRLNRKEAIQLLAEKNSFLTFIQGSRRTTKRSRFIFLNKWLI